MVTCEIHRSIFHPVGMRSDFLHFYSSCCSKKLDFALSIVSISRSVFVRSGSCTISQCVRKGTDANAMTWNLDLGNPSGMPSRFRYPQIPSVDSTAASKFSLGKLRPWLFMTIGIEVRPLHTFSIPIGNGIATRGLSRVPLILGSYRNFTRLIILHFWTFILYVPFGIFVELSNVGFGSLITSSANGFDVSMMNGLQSLPQWVSAFHNPSDRALGTLNAIQVGSQMPYP